MAYKPNVRQLLVAQKLRGVDPLVDEVLDNPDGELAKELEQAVEWSKSDTRRGYIEACLLTTDSIASIADLLEVDAGVLLAYSQFIYCTEGLDKIARLELVDADANTSSMKLWAVSQGLDFIAWRLGRRVNISPVEGLRDMFSTCVYKSKECLFNANSSKSSVESVKWVKLSVEIAKLLKVWVMDSNAAKKDLELALQEILPEFKFITDLDGIDVEAMMQAQEFADARKDDAKPSQVD